MVRHTALAFAATVLASAALAAPQSAPEKAGSPPPPTSSHTPTTPEAKPVVKKADEKKAAEPADKAPAKTAATAKTPWQSQWRKDYIAKHGHAPGAPGKATAAAKKPASNALPAKPKHCT